MTNFVKRVLEKHAEPTNGDYISSVPIFFARDRALGPESEALFTGGVGAVMNGERAFQKQLTMIRAGTRLERVNALLRRIKGRLPDVDAWLAESADEWCEEDGVYHFYHQSNKVFGRLQGITREGFELISAFGGEQDPPCEWYSQIVREGTKSDFNEKTNDEWLQQTRPILEAFWHTKYFLSMMAKYGKLLDTAQRCVPSGWAALLYLFELR